MDQGQDETLLNYRIYRSQSVQRVRQGYRVRSLQNKKKKQTNPSQVFAPIKAQLFQYQFSSEKSSEIISHPQRLPRHALGTHIQHRKHKPSKKEQQIMNNITFLEQEIRIFDEEYRRKIRQINEFNSFYLAANDPKLMQVFLELSVEVTDDNLKVQQMKTAAQEELKRLHGQLRKNQIKQLKMKEMKHKPIKQKEESNQIERNESVQRKRQGDRGQSLERKKKKQTIPSQVFTSMKPQLFQCLISSQKSSEVNSQRQSGVQPYLEQFYDQMFQVRNQISQTCAKIRKRKIHQRLFKKFLNDVLERLLKSGKEGNNSLIFLDVIAYNSSKKSLNSLQSCMQKDQLKLNGLYKRLNALKDSRKKCQKDCFEDKQDNEQVK